MKCRICARECPQGSKLCRDCAAARKRAFAATVTQPLLAAAGAPTIGQRFAPRPAKPRKGSKSAAATPAPSAAALVASTAWTKVTPRRIGVQWLWYSLAVALMIVYLLFRILASTRDEPSGDAVTLGSTAKDVATPAAVSHGVAPGTAVVPLQPPPAANPAASAVAPAAEAQDATAPAAKNVATKARARKAAAKVELPDPVPPPAPIAEPVPEPQPPPPQAAAPPRDPWQPMNEGLARCAREDWIGRANCEQRLRLQYCATHWGLVAQCPIGPSDHGS